MAKSNFAELLTDRRMGAKAVAEEMVKDPKNVKECISALSSEVAAIQFTAAKALWIASELKPEALYPHFDFFAEMLGSKNNVMKWTAIEVVGSLAAADREEKFDSIFPKLCKMAGEGSLITSAHVFMALSKAVNAKPELGKQAVCEILKVEDAKKTPLPTDECRKILSGHVIKALDSMFDALENPERKKAIEFSKRQLESSRSGTRKRAERFVRDHSGK